MNKLSPFKSLKNPLFRNFLFGAFISEIGNQMQIVAVSWDIYEMTKNPASLGLIGLANLVPILLFSLFGGVVADKHDRKKLLIFSHIGLFILAATLFTTNLLGFNATWIIYLILVLMATVNSFVMPARQAVLPHLVPKEIFVNAVSLNTLEFQTSVMIGPAIAGFLIAAFGVKSVYLYNAFSFLIFTFILYKINIPFSEGKKEVELNLDAVWEGVKFVITTPILYLTTILDFIATFFSSSTILMPVFAKDILHVGPQGLGLLYAAPSIGGVIAGLLMSSIHKIKNQGVIILGSVILYGFATIGFGLSTFLPLSLFFLAISGFGDMVSTIIRNTIRQMVTPDHLRGRMISILRIFFQGGPQLGDIEAGLLAAAAGGPVSVIVGGAGTVIATAIIAFKSPTLRKYQGKELAV